MDSSAVPRWAVGVRSGVSVYPMVFAVALRIPQRDLPLTLLAISRAAWGRVGMTEKVRITLGRFACLPNPEL